MRHKPYTAIGISRVPCFRCGQPSTQQWQICSLLNEYKGLCTHCDVELNKRVLRFMRIPEKRAVKLIANYEQTLKKGK